MLRCQRAQAVVWQAVKFLLSRMGRYPLLLGSPLLLGLSACVAPGPYSGEEELFRVERLAFIEIGKSTKEEIATVMSNLRMEQYGVERRVRLTPTEFRGGDWWLYVQTREEMEWFVLGEGVTDTVDYRALLLKFDDNGIVAEYETSSSEFLGCNASGICFGNHHHNLLASEDEDRAAKQLDLLADRCGVYVYGKPPPRGPPQIDSSIWLDGHRVSWLLDRKKFFFWQVEEGVHELSSHGGYSSERRPVDCNCVPGGSYFFEIKQKQKGVLFGSRWIEIEQQDAVKGRNAIDRRRLTLNATHLSRIRGRTAFRECGSTPFFSLDALGSACRALRLQRTG